MMDPSRRNAIAINLAVWMGLTICVGIFGSIAGFRSSSLSRHFATVKGSVIGLRPDQHQSFDYVYRVAAATYEGNSSAGDADRNFESIKPRDNVTVFYDTAHPDSSTLGPSDMPGIRAMSSLIGLCLAVPLLLMGLLHHYRMLPYWRLFKTSS
jgi:hypothetical protein